MANVLELDAQTGETLERDFTETEWQQREADQIAAKGLAAEAEAAEAARVKAVQNSQAELKAMGLSDQTIATISGYPYPYAPAV